MTSSLKSSLVVLCALACLGCTETSDTSDSRTIDSLTSVANAAMAAAETARLEAERIAAEEERKRNDPDYQREMLLQQEHRNWRSLLRVVNTEWKVPFFGASHLKLAVTSQASLASFKDIELSIRFLSKTGAVLRRYEHIVYDYVVPNGMLQVRVDDLKPPAEAASFDVDVVGARAASHEVH